MDENAQRVLDESRRFRARLSELVPKYDGRWVIYLNDAVQEAFDEEKDAYTAAVHRFGVRGGFVIAQVTPRAAEPIVLSAAFSSLDRDTRNAVP